MTGQPTQYCFMYDFLEAWEPITWNLQKVTPFIFGLFSSLALTRWWSTRTDCVGKVMDATVHLTAALAGWAARKCKTSDEYDCIEQDIVKILKLGVASLQCIAMQSRDNYDCYNNLIDTELITKEEARVLEGCHSSAQVCISWVLSLAADILNRLGVPRPNHNPLYMETVMAANAITTREAYHETQLPFPYVHMICMLVQIHNTVVSFVDGLHMSLAVHEQMWTVLGIRILHLLLITSMYQALLQVCFLMEDPLGHDLTDFPILQFQLRIYNESKHVLMLTRTFWERRRAQGLALPMPTPAPAPQPAPAAAPSGLEPAIVAQFEGVIAKQLAETRRCREDVLKSLDELQKRTGPS